MAATFSFLTYSKDILPIPRTQLGLGVTKFVTILTAHSLEDY